ncbi:SPX domain-containing protein 4-like [Nicotiana tomentosiformis]|uniref:SPX domain-containing protein 4-like n=1 Tax=Nicotiana tomentosiformis TaxID=4098 RepID=UPI00388CB61D
MKLEDLVIRLKIEDDNYSAEKKSRGNSTIMGANIVEETAPKRKKRKRKGFIEKYFVWTNHGEINGSHGIFHNMVVGESSRSVENTNLDSRIQDMVEDVFGGEPNENIEQTPNDDAKRFYEHWSKKEIDKTFMFVMHELQQRIRRVIDTWGPNGSQHSETDYKEEMAMIRKDIVDHHGEMEGFKN